MLYIVNRVFLMEAFFPAGFGPVEREPCRNQRNLWEKAGAEPCRCRKTGY